MLSIVAIVSMKSGKQSKKWKWKQLRESMEQKRIDQGVNFHGNGIKGAWGKVIMKLVQEVHSEKPLGKLFMQFLHFFY